MDITPNKPIRLSIPDILTSTRWKPIPDPEGVQNGPTMKFEGLKTFVKKICFRLSDKLISLRGGRMLSPDRNMVGDEVGNHLASERSIAVIPAIEGNETQLNRVVHFPTEVNEIHFSANLAAYRALVAIQAAIGWDVTKLGKFPIPVALSSEKVDNGYATVTEYRPGINSLGLDGPKKGVHQLDTKKISLDEIRRLVRVLDAIHIDSGLFLEWLGSVRESNNQMSPPAESWLNNKNAKCALRGQEWWINPKTDNDRLHELRGKIDEASALYQEADPQLDTKQALQTMIENNLKLYRHQDGHVEEGEGQFLGESVVVHGTLNPDQIHIRQDSQTGAVNYTITGGDRSQLYGLRGQMIDWLVSSCAVSPDHQQALIEEFKKIQTDKGRDIEKEMRGLAMHVMYRCVSEAPWFVKEGKMQEAKNLVKMTHDILKGEGIWSGVNTPLHT